MSNSSGVPVLQSHGVSTGPGLDSSLGVLLIAALLSMALWGVTCVQTYEYSLDNTDGLFQRSIVGLLWVIDTLSSAMHCHTMYFFLITNFGNPTALMKSTWGISSQPLITAIATFIIRTMFARRIYTLSENNIILTTYIMTVSICDFVVNLVIVGKAFRGAAFGAHEKISRLMYLSFALGILGESSIAIALCWILNRARTGFRRTDSLVKILMIYVVNTGLLVAIVSTVALITFLTMQTSLISFGIMLLLPKLYVNAYLASLNARGRLRAKDSDTSVQLSRLRAGTRPNSTLLTTDAGDESGISHKSPTAITFRTSGEQNADECEDNHKDPPRL